MDLFVTFRRRVYYNRMGAASKVFYCFSCSLIGWSRIILKVEWKFGFSDIFSRHICSTIAETIGVTNYAARFGAKKCSENHNWSCWDDARSVEPTILVQAWINSTYNVCKITFTALYSYLNAHTFYADFTFVSGLFANFSNNQHFNVLKCSIITTTF